MIVILKIPIAYLCLVVYWAVKAEAKPPEPVRSASRADGPDPKGAVVAEEPQASPEARA